MPSKQGFYITSDRFPWKCSKTVEELYSAIMNGWDDKRKKQLKECKEYFMEACNGNTTERISKKLELNRV